MTEDSNEKIVVRIDAELEDLIPGFLNGRRNDINTITECLEKEDFDTILMIGHSMKGNGAGYGFDEITDIGRFIEDAARAKGKERTKEGIHRLELYLNAVEVIYE